MVVDAPKSAYLLRNTCNADRVSTGGYDSGSPIQRPGQRVDVLTHARFDAWHASIDSFPGFQTLSVILSETE